LAVCSAIARSGGRCKGIAIDGSGLCHAHHPDRADARRQAARKGGQCGGRGRPMAEVADVKRRLSDLAEKVLDGTVDRADAAVVGQLLGTVIRAIGTELKVREQMDLIERLDELEAVLAQRREAGAGA
jgi:hypothetical protein